MNAAAVTPGDVVIVVGIGGIGVNAVQGAHHAGASAVIAVDPLELKRDTALKLGATHAFADIGEATEVARSLTDGQGADAAILCVGVLARRGRHRRVRRDPQGRHGGRHRGRRSDRAGRLDRAPRADHVPEADPGRALRDDVARRDVPRLLGLWRTGALRLEELITRTYSLDEINQGYADLHAGEIIRGIVRFDE